MKKQIDKFWKTRARCYEKLEWATKSGYLHSFLKAGRFKRNDCVLDIGTGTGIIAHTIAPHVHKVVGIDLSAAMLTHALEHQVRDEFFMKADARRLPFIDGSFSKVTARMVFHHILQDPAGAMAECFRVTRKKGLMLFSEGVPPTAHVKPFYVAMFKLKEERLTFMEHDMVRLMKDAGFTIEKKIIHWNRQSSIKNWLVNSGLPQESQDAIFTMHRDLDARGKKDYAMTERDGDCFIDMKFVIVVGRK